MMPDAKNDNGFCMYRVPYNIFSEHGIAHDIRLWRQRNATAKLREAPNVLDARDELCSNTRCCRRVFLGDEYPETNQIGNGLFRVDQPH